MLSWKIPAMQRIARPGSGEGMAEGLRKWHVSSSFAALTRQALFRALIQWLLNKPEKHPTPPFAAGALSECDKRSLIFNLTSAYNIQVASLFSQRCYKQGLSQGNRNGNIKIVLKTSLVLWCCSSCPKLSTPYPSDHHGPTTWISSQWLLLSQNKQPWSAKVSSCAMVIMDIETPLRKHVVNKSLGQSLFISKVCVQHL